MLQLLSALWLMLISGGLYGWALVIAKWRRGERLLPDPPDEEAPWGLIDLITAIVFLLLSQVAALLIVTKLRGLPSGMTLLEMSATDRVLMVVVSAAGQLLSFVVTLLFVKLRTGADLRTLGFDSSTLASDLRLGGLSFVLLAPPVYALQILLTQWFKSSHPLIEMLIENPDAYFVAGSGFAAVIVAPITEEFLFRVLLLGWLERWTVCRDFYSLLFGGRDDTPARDPLAREQLGEEPRAAGGDDGDAPTDGWSSHGEASPNEDGTPAKGAPANGTRSPHWWPVTLSAAIFALMHYSHGPDPIPLFVLAFGMGLLYQRTRRITPGLVVHFLLNLFTFLVLIAQLYGAQPPP